VTKGWSVKLFMPLEVAIYLFARCDWSKNGGNNEEYLDESFSDPSILDPILGQNWQIMDNFHGEVHDGFLDLFADAPTPITLWYDFDEEMLRLHCRVLYYNAAGVPQFGLPNNEKPTKRRREDTGTLNQGSEETVWLD
jgi:hypothetical protein